MRKIGSNQYQYKCGLSKDAIISVWAVAFFTLAGVNLVNVLSAKVTSPCPDTGCNNHFIKTVYAKEELTSDEQMDKWVNQYAKKYGSTRYEQNRLKALAHYLLFREQNYAGSTACGDSGKACGAMQFHEETYVRNRKDMMKKGLVLDMGSRLDTEDAIETAIYMFSIGQENQWGPVKRKEIKL